MDSTLIGSLIQAGATIISVIVAVFILRSELNLTREQMKLVGYENLLSREQHLFEVIMSDEVGARQFLEHFMIEGVKVPADFASVKLWIIVMAQISAYENLFYRHEKSFFPKELWSQWDRSMANSFLKDPVFGEVWDSTDFKDYLWVRFTEHVDKNYFHVGRRDDEK